MTIDRMNASRALRGLTLLEVVLALAILTASFATLAQLVGVAVRAARQGRELTRGQLVAESLMAEIAAGAIAADNLSAVPVDTDPGWLVSATVTPTMQDGIIQVTVMAQQDSASRRRAEFVLSRWMRDPNLAIPEDPVREEDAASSSSTSGTEGSGSGDGGAGGGNNAGGGNTGGGQAGGNPQGNAGGNQPGGGGQNTGNQPGGGGR